MTDLSPLISALQAAEGPSRELDARICVALQYGGGGSEGATNVRIDDDWDGDVLFEIGTEECCNPIPRLTESLDAATALVERLLPGWRKSFFQGRSGTWIARVSSPRAETFSTDYMRERTPDGSPNGAIAIVLAALKAKEAGDA